jgi:hypothetical protein
MRATLLMINAKDRAASFGRMGDSTSGTGKLASSTGSEFISVKTGIRSRVSGRMDGRFDGWEMIMDRTTSRMTEFVSK